MGGSSLDFVVPYLGSAIIAFPKAFKQNVQAGNKSYCDIKPFSINKSWPGQGNNGVSNLFTLCSQHLFTATLVSDAALLVLFSHGLITVLLLELNVLFVGMFSCQLVYVFSIKMKLHLTPVI